MSMYVSVRVILVVLEVVRIRAIRVAPPAANNRAIRVVCSPVTRLAKTLAADSVQVLLPTN